MIYDVEVRADRIEMEEEALNELNSLRKFEFSYYGWIPYYGDFDQDWVTILAPSKEEAEKIFYSTTKFVKGKPYITELFD